MRDKPWRKLSERDDCMKEHDQGKNKNLVSSYKNLGVNEDDAVTLMYFSRVAANVKLGNTEVKQVKGIVGRYDQNVGKEIKKHFPKYF